MVNNVRDVNNWPVAPSTTVTFSLGAASASTQPQIYQWFTIVGKAGSPGSAGGTNSAARFSGPTGVAVHNHGNLYVVDQSNCTIRMGMPLPVFQSVTPVNGSIELTWSAAPGQTFQLQYNSGLASTTWTNLGAPVTATSATMSATDTSGPNPQHFYRVIVQP